MRLRGTKPTIFGQNIFLQLDIFCLIVLFRSSFSLGAMQVAHELLGFLLFVTNYFLAVQLQYDSTRDPQLTRVMARGTMYIMHVQHFLIILTRGILKRVQCQDV